MLFTGAWRVGLFSGSSIPRTQKSGELLLFQFFIKIAQTEKLSQFPPFFNSDTQKKKKGKNFSCFIFCCSQEYEKNIYFIFLFFYELFSGKGIM